MKPSYESILVVRKPIGCKNIAENCLVYGTGSMNIDDCRIKTNEVLKIGSNNHTNASVFNHHQNIICDSSNKGRFPSNIILQDTESVIGLFPYTKSGGKLKKHNSKKKATNNIKFSDGQYQGIDLNANECSASRYFYCSKASNKDRNLGLENSDIKEKETRGGGTNNIECAGKFGSVKVAKKNAHPTVKPLSLITYLVKLISPPEDCLILDPFMGSGTTGLACKNVGVNFVGIELNKDYFNIAKTSIENYNPDINNKKQKKSNNKKNQLDLF